MGTAVEGPQQSLIAQFVTASMTSHMQNLAGQKCKKTTACCVPERMVCIWANLPVPVHAGWIVVSNTFM